MCGCKGADTGTDEDIGTGVDAGAAEAVDCIKDALAVVVDEFDSISRDTKIQMIGR